MEFFVRPPAVACAQAPRMLFAERSAGRSRGLEEFDRCYRPGKALVGEPQGISAHHVAGLDAALRRGAGREFEYGAYWNTR